MRIDSYTFGRVVVGGNMYTNDVIVSPGGVDATWRRQEGHLLQFEDIAAALEERPDVLVIGTGYLGQMRFTRETFDRITGLGIEVRVNRTSRAVDIFNELSGSRRVIAALHITC